MTGGAGGGGVKRDWGGRGAKWEMFKVQSVMLQNRFH